MTEQEFNDRCNDMTIEELKAKLEIMQKAYDRYLELGGSGEDYIGESYARAINEMKDVVAFKVKVAADKECSERLNSVEHDSEIDKGLEVSLEETSPFRTISLAFQEGKIREGAQMAADYLMDRLDFGGLSLSRKSNMGKALGLAFSVIVRQIMKEE